MNFSSEWMLFFGHFHPVVVHLPIGAVVLAIFLEFFVQPSESKILKGVWFFAAISAGISCLFGWFLSQSGEYDIVTTERHQWAGIAVLILTVIISGAYFLRIQSLDNKWFKRIPVAISGLLVLITGHLGGNLTHGADYLTMHTPEPFRAWFGLPEKEADKKPIITNINEAIVYSDIIRPILKEKCWSCHNATKIKGKLRMDEPELLKKGGKNGVIFIAGNAEKSELVRRVTLPENNDDHMPPEGKTPISKNELILLKWWINSGADFSKKVAEFGNQTAEEKTALAALVSGNSKDEKELKEPSVLDKPIAEVNTDILQKLRSKNVLLTPISEKDNYLDISTINAKLSDSLFLELAQIGKHIINLNLSNKALPKGTIQFLNSCENLMSLRLDGSTISDAEIKQLKSFQHLRYLNLFNTAIGDASLAHLVHFPELVSLYCSKTSVTETGVIAAQKQAPEMQIIYQNAAFLKPMP